MSRTYREHHVRHVEKPKNERGKGPGRDVSPVIGGVCTSVCMYVRV